MVDKKIINLIDSRKPVILGHQVVIEFSGTAPDVQITVNGNVITPHPTDIGQGIATQISAAESMALIGMFVQQVLIRTTTRPDVSTDRN